MDSNGFLWFQMDYGSQLFMVVIHGYRWLQMDIDGSLMVSNCFEWLLMDPNSLRWFCCLPVVSDGSKWILMAPNGF